MSLDVYLYGEPETVECECPCCGNKHQNTRATHLYSDNITHNLNTMADNAGIYSHLWRPDEIGITKARELIEPLRAGLTLLKAKPEHFGIFDAPNGWGVYADLVQFVEGYLAACELYPDAKVQVSR